VFKDAEALYMDALMEELAAADTLLGGRRVRALYIGGGTPTALCEENLARVVRCAAKIAGADAEFTVEAGRPDTITAAKLRIIQDAGAGRISVNAQTLRDKTLERIGRRHTAAQFMDAFALARRCGFKSINVDIIAGLPDETAADVEATVRAVIGLAPENITVHTLAVKRASKFARDNMAAFPTSAATGIMVDTARGMLAAAGYHPYYMYRQKYMKGSQENTGYALRGYDCIYNIDNMEELCDVMAFGAGAISKRVFHRDARIERAANLKDLREYIARHREMIERKRALFGE
jgi:oxygen-independent coproporphyrinogen-3 oxidase